MGAPQIILCVCLALTMGIHLAKHGELRNRPNYHAGWYLLDACFTLGLLYWGGFFA